MKKNLCSGLVLRLVSFAASTAIAVGFVTPPLASYAAAPLFAQGSGTKADPYLITSQQELSNIRKTDGLFFRLEKDLTLYQWEPIGTADDPLVGGGFDGNGYKISSMKAGGADYAGLFGYTQRLSVINLGVDTASVSANTAGGGIVGRASGGSIKNCYVTGEIKGDKYAGGIVGVADDTVIQGCYTNTALSGPGYKGGISGTGGNVSDCYFSTDLIGQSVGQLSPTQLKNAFDSSAGGTPTSVMQSGNFPLKLSTSKLASATEWNTLEEGAFPTQVTNRTRVLPSYEANTSAVSPLAAGALPVNGEISMFTPGSEYSKYETPFDKAAVNQDANIPPDTDDGTTKTQVTITGYSPISLGDNLVVYEGATVFELDGTTPIGYVATNSSSLTLRDSNDAQIIVYTATNTDGSSKLSKAVLDNIEYPDWSKSYRVVKPIPLNSKLLSWTVNYSVVTTTQPATPGDPPVVGAPVLDSKVGKEDLSINPKREIVQNSGFYYNPQVANTFIPKQTQKIEIVDTLGDYRSFAYIDVYTKNPKVKLTDADGDKKFEVYKFASSAGGDNPAKEIIKVAHVDSVGPLKDENGVVIESPNNSTALYPNGYRIFFNLPNNKDNLIFNSPGSHLFELKHKNNEKVQERLVIESGSPFELTLVSKRSEGLPLTVTPSLNSLDVSWSPSPNITSYNVYIQEGDKRLDMDTRIELEKLGDKMHSNVTTTSVTLKGLKSSDSAGLKPGTEYTVAVAAMSSTNYTVFYGPKLVTTKSIPALVKSNVTSTSVNLTWPKQDETSNWTYMLYMSSSDITKPDAKFDGAASQVATGTQWSWSKLEPGKKYYFNVKATNNITGQEVTYQGVEVTTLVQGQLSAPVITTNVSNPKALPAGGKATITMKHDNTSECSIYYTLDGTTPNINSTKYSAPFEITSKNLNGETISISAICLQDGLTPSTITKLDLTFGKSSLLPIDGKVLDIYDHAWSEIVAALESSTTGSVEIMLDENTTTIPKSFFAAIAGKDMTVILNMGSYYWTLKGKDVKTARDSIDMGLVYGNDLSLVSNRYLSKLDEVDYIDLYQMSLNHDGGFPFDAKLTLNLGKGNSGSFGNMYYVNENRKKLDYMESATIGKTGNASYDFSHASSYVIVVSEEQMANIGSGAFIEDIIVPIQKLPPVIPICAGALGVGIVMMIIVRKITKD